jgi:hypothetical protein
MFGDKAVLIDADGEPVGKAVARQPVQSAEAVGPVVVQRQAVAADGVEIHPAVRRGGDLEAGGVDDAVHLVVPAVGHHAGLGDALHALRIRDVHQFDVGPVEGGQILVVEGGPLAELAVPGLQRIGGLGVFHGLVAARADLVHLLEVGDLRAQHDLVHVEIAGILAPVHERDADAPGDVGPAVGHQVLAEVLTQQRGCEVLAARALPAGLQATGTTTRPSACCRADPRTTACAGKRRASARARRGTARTESPSPRCR